MQVEILPLLEQLRSQVVQITFNKADGSMRVMNATLQSEHLPETQSATSGSGGVTQPDHHSVGHGCARVA